MACKCGSENQKLFPADVKIYFDSTRSAAPPAVFPDVLVCLDCGIPNSAFREDGMNYRHSAGPRPDDARHPDRMKRGHEGPIISERLSRQCKIPASVHLRTVPSRELRFSRLLPLRFCPPA